jgi:hypothetical protein
MSDPFHPSSEFWAEVDRRARRLRRRRRRQTVGASAAVVVAGVALIAALVLARPSASTTVRVVAPPSTPATTRVTTLPSTTLPVMVTAPTTAASTSTTSQATPATTSPTTIAAGKHLPISVESDSQMKQDGNYGPSSSILEPTSCQLTGTTVTARGGYANGGFVPNVYNRYGDIIALYVFAAPSPGYPRGVQMGASSASAAPQVGIQAPWQVSASFDPSIGTPATCVVAAQPTHAVQLAP